jgi:urease accessory protein
MDVAPTITDTRGCATEAAPPAPRRGIAHDAKRPERLRGYVPAPCTPGAGHIELAQVSGATAVIRRLAASPLKLLTPRGANGTAHVVTSTYGGGLLAGDDVALRLDAGPDTRCVLGTQASTKVYRSTDGRPARQSLDAAVAAGAVVVIAPDPVTCFAGARYGQRQHFRLHGGASLLLIDWITSGRVARGERWAFDNYRSDIRIDVEGFCVARDALLLDPSHGPIDAPHRMGRFECLATVYLLGRAFTEAAAGLLARVTQMSVRKRAPLILAASPIQGGTVARVAGGAAETVGRFLGQQLASAWAAVGADPWSSKW